MPAGRYSSAGEYVRDLIQGDENRKADERLEILLLERLKGEGSPLTRQGWTAIRKEGSRASPRVITMFSRGDFSTYKLTVSASVSRDTHAVFGPRIAPIWISAEIPGVSCKAQIMLIERPRLRLSTSVTRVRVPRILSKSLRESPCCSIRNLIASIGPGGSMG